MSRSQAATAAAATGARTEPAAPPAAATAAPAPACETTHARSLAASSSDDDASLTGGIARALAAGGSALSRVGGALFRVPIKAFRQNKFNLDEGHLHSPALTQPAAAGHAAGAAAPASATHAGGQAGSAKKPSPLRLLAAQQGPATVLLKQVAPSLLANVAVGAVMFSSFDHTIAVLAQMQARGDVPQWMCSSALSSGYVAPHCAPSCAADPATPAAAAAAVGSLQPFVGLDVLLAGMVAGASQTPLVTPMENSASWIRIKYRFLEAHMHAAGGAASGAAQASTASSATAAATAAAAYPHGMGGVSTAAVEATATTFLPPLPPQRIHSLNIASSLLEQLRFRSGAAAAADAGAGAVAAAATATVSAGPHSSAPSLRPLGAPLLPTHGLFSHVSFRLARDSLGLGLFFYSFENVHARLRLVPYRWMEVQEERQRQARKAARRAQMQVEQQATQDNSRSTGTAAAASASAVITAPISTPAAAVSAIPSPGSAHPDLSDQSDTPSVPLLGGLLAWECVSVVSAGLVAGSAYHFASYPFFHALQRVENDAWRTFFFHAQPHQPTPPPLSAWGHLLQLHREHGVRGLFRGAWGGPTAGQVAASAGQAASAAAAAVAQSGRRPRLFNALVVGLVVYTLSKTEHHSHQLKQWRAQRRLARQEAKRLKALARQQQQQQQALAL